MANRELMMQLLKISEEDMKPKNITEDALIELAELLDGLESAVCELAEMIGGDENG